VNSRHAVSRATAIAVVLAATVLLVYGAQQGAPNIGAVRRVDRFTRPTVPRLPPVSDGGYPGCPNTRDLCPENLPRSDPISA